MLKMTKKLVSNYKFTINLKIRDFLVLLPRKPLMFWLEICILTPFFRHFFHKYDVFYRSIGIGILIETPYF